MDLRQKRDIRRLGRQIIQIIFFLWMPALYTSAFSGVRYVIEQIRAGKPIEQNAFLVMLIALCGFTILFGRFFCGCACAFGTLGDGMYAFSKWVQKKVKKKLPWVSEETGRKLQKIKYIMLLVLMLIYALGFTKKFHGTSPWEVFSMLYTGKIPDAGYLAGWIIFVVILVGMCLKERFFCQYLCPMGAIFAWLPVLPFSVLDRDRSNCIPKCRACEIKCPVDYQIKRDQKNGGECIHCMQCVDVCPKQNIHLGSGKKLKGNEIIIILLKLVLFIGVCIFAQSLSGKTIKKITYILRETEAYEESGKGGVTQVPACDGKDIVIDNLNLKVAPYVDVTVNDVERSKDGTKVTFNNLPAGNDFEVTKITKGTGKGVPSLTEDQYSYKDGVLTLNSSVEASIDTAYYVTLESKSGSYATVKVTAMVKPLLADDAKITAKDVTYNPKGIKVFVDTSKVPEDAAYTVAKVKNGSKVLSEDSYEYKDGVLTFNKNVAVGTYVVTFESAKYQDVKVSVKVNKAKGTLTTKAKTTVNTAIGSKSFNLGAKATTGMKVSYASSNKKVATVSSNGTVSVKGTGIATITVTASGSNYNTVTKKITIKVAPKKQSVKAKTAKKKLTITWTKDSNATGYQVQIATKKNLKGAKTYTVKSYKTYKKTISKLKSKKKYYVRVRSYKTVGKTKLYGAYSTVKSYKVK